MWLPLILLALMASGSACPDLCECHQSAAERDQPTLLVHVKCRGRAPGLSELPSKTESLSVDGADEYEVIGFLDELEVGDSLNDFGMIGTLNELDANGTLDEPDPGNTTILFPYLDELSLTNCSLVFLNASWNGFERVRALNLSRNNLTRLNNVLVGRMTNTSELTRFDLSDNSLTYVSAGAFRTLAGLVRLSLRGNQISTVHEDAFQGLGRLEFLDLSDNRLTDLPDSALTPLYSLQKLDLSGNQLQVLGARWFESLDRLRELDVSRNGLARAASGTLQPLPGLSVLKLSENPLKERDVSLLLGTGRRLETVDASRTGLARVPATLTRSVRALRLAGNKLTTIRGGDLDSYPLLRILDISDNRLLDIEDDALGRLEVLQELDISGNVLVKVPGSLPGSLTHLKLQRNAITALRIDDLQGLYNLKSLTLNDNRINEIEVGALGQLPVLEELDLSDNPIKTLPANTLSGPSNLAKLHMSGLTSLERKQEEQSDMAFPVPTPERLVYLDVSRSPALAEQLLADDAALSACKSLAELNLSETNITGLRFDLPYMLPQLRALDLSGNRWNCTEDLYWLGEWLRQHKQLNKDAEPGQCDTPREMSGSLLYELPSPPSPLPITVPTTTLAVAASTLSILPPIERASHFNKPNQSSNATDVDASTVTVNIIDESISTGDTTRTAYTEANLEIDHFRNATDNSTASKTNGRQPVSTSTRFYEAPTSFRNVTTSESWRGRDLGKKTKESSAGIKNSIIDVAGPSYRRTTEGGPSIIRMKNDDSDPGTFDNRIDGDGQRGGKSEKLSVSPSKITSSKLSKLARLKEEAGGRKTAEKHSKKLNNLTKESPTVLGNAPDSNTIAEELNSRATDSDARVSEALSAGAHPGMLVLAGAALGAAAALTVVLSRRATVRRRDRYHRHENIEVHTLTPTTELW